MPLLFQRSLADVLVIAKKVTMEKTTNKAESSRKGKGGYSFYLLIGVLLALGAPLGAFLFRFLYTEGGFFYLWARNEIAANAGFYVYITLGPLLILGITSLIIARFHLRLKQTTHQLSEQAKQLEDISQRDPLTGLFNFRYIQQRLNIELERSKRFQTPLSCLMMDLDHLKEINDDYGHKAGDVAMRAVAKLLQEDIRLIDTATRYGGDEFLIILPVTGKQGAWVAAERLRAHIAGLNIDYLEQKLKVTMSIGIATYPSANISDIDSFVRLADQGLYEAKKKGRNQSSFSLTQLAEGKKDNFPQKL